MSTPLSGVHPGSYPPPSEPLSDEFVATLAAQYEIEHEIGRGGMAVVYVAHDLRHRRRVALKVLHPGIASAIGKQRFLREIETVAGLAHPNIVPLYDSGEAAGILYFVMPFVEGRSLCEVLAEKGVLPVDEAIHIATDATEALDFAHRAGVIHRDVKPGNILILSGHAVVSDFGIAHVDSRDALTTDQGSLGTPAYASPEQREGGVVDARSDVYSLGVVLHEMLPGQRPANPTRSSIASPPVSALRKRVDGQLVPAHVDRAVQRALAYDPAARFSTARDFARALREHGSVTSRILGVGAAVLALIALVVVLIPRAGAPSRSGIKPTRVVVDQFENRTGDASLDIYDVMAADWITVGLQRTGFVDVVPTSLVQSARVEATRSANTGQSEVQRISRATNAGIVVTGAFYRDRDEIVFQVQVVDVATAKLLGAFEPVRAAFATPAAAIDSVRTRVMGLLATTLDRRIATSVAMSEQPPTFEAYKEFILGLDDYVRTRFDSSGVRFMRAFELDHKFISSLLMASISLSNQAKYAAADSLLRIIEPRRTELSEYDRSWFDYRRSLLAGDRPGALAAVRRLAAEAPGTKATYNLAVEAFQNGYLSEARAALLSLAPDAGPMQGWAPYWDVLTRVEHLQGQHRDEWKAATRARTAFPDRIFVVNIAARALGALGDAKQLDQLFDSAASLGADPGGTTLTAAMLEAGIELRAHGHGGDARRMLLRALAWDDAHLGDGNRSAAKAFTRGRVLYELGRWNDSRAICDSLASVRPDPDYYGLAGAAAARAGDALGAQRELHQVRALPAQYTAGAVAFNEARILAALGARDSAVAVLRRAFAEGKAYGLWIDQDGDFAPLRGLPGYDTLVAAKAGPQ